MDTEHQFSSVEARRAVKQLFARALAAFPELTFEAVASICDESPSLIKAWCDAKRPHCPPMWALGRLQQRHPGMAAYLEVGLQAIACAASHPSAHTFEAQMNVSLGAIAKVIDAHCESIAGAGQYDAPRTERQLALMVALRRTIDRSIESAQRRLGVISIGSPADNDNSMRAVAGGRR